MRTINEDSYIYLDCSRPLRFSRHAKEKESERVRKARPVGREGGGGGRLASAKSPGLRYRPVLWIHSSRLTIKLKFEKIEGCEQSNIHHLWRPLFFSWLACDVIIF